MDTLEKKTHSWEGKISSTCCEVEKRQQVEGPEKKPIQIRDPFDTKMQGCNTINVRAYSQGFSLGFSKNVRAKLQQQRTERDNNATITRVSCAESDMAVKPEARRKNFFVQ